MPRIAQRRVPLVLVSLLLGGCYQQIVTAPNVPREPEALRYRTSRISYAWGLLQRRDSLPACPNHGGIAEVQVRSNFGQSLVQFLTLGIIVPRSVTYLCAPREEPPSPIGSAAPADSARTLPAAPAGPASDPAER